IPSLTSNGRLSRPRKPRTSGSGRVALVSSGLLRCPAPPSQLDFRERFFDLLALSLPLLIGGRLRFWTGKPIQHPPPSKRYKVVSSISASAPETEETVKHLYFEHVERPATLQSVVMK